MDGQTDFSRKQEKKNYITFWVGKDQNLVANQVSFANRYEGEVKTSSKNYYFKNGYV